MLFCSPLQVAEDELLAAKTAVQQALTMVPENAQVGGQPLTPCAAERRGAPSTAWVCWAAVRKSSACTGQAPFSQG